MQTTAGAPSRYADPVVAQRQAYALLYGRLPEQAGLWGYVDTFRSMLLMCAACVPLVLLFTKVRHSGPIAVH